MEDEFETRNGFPRSAASLANWRTQPFSRWAFRNTAELIPSARIATATPRPLPAVQRNAEIMSRPIGAANETVAWFLARSQTDSFLMARDGRIVAEWHAAGVDRGDPHLLFSITKSITALIFAILEERGLVDPALSVGMILPETRRSAYGDATLRDLLDMRVSIDFDEQYLSQGDYARYRRAMLWNPPLSSGADENLFALLCDLKKADAPHGGAHYYCSPNSDMLGAVIEKSAGRRVSDLVSDLLWKPLQAHADAFLTVDNLGAPRTAGGMSCRPHDLLAVGELLLNDGTAAGARILPQRWIDDMRHNGDAHAWADGNQADFLPEGRYRSQWYQVGGDSEAYLAVGIHGQFLYIDPPSRTVVVKLASQDEPQDDSLDRENLALFRRLCA
ncbi:serine hydrolase domain-containing protein [Pseudohoeflea coraliihabitans]|uniref:Beta-lactamase family protein n=1 Tax=Pseudohoeflea coraliihabitans TaxID=2860393 RepID=A0ABS6WL70_9HYPH|nr:serine hydrolase [Pseudohoeflea sp. DP4N28-3]MBW3096177.1 beta-lactamase family protein [Pseudohoeflea sp. DP4N28-3]